MVEKQVDEEVFFIDLEVDLSSDKGESVTHTDRLRIARPVEKMLDICNGYIKII